jgi:L-aminopeptidase/D-esterase-like protein
MLDAIVDVAGIQVGHAQDEEALTGCSVVLCTGGAVVGVSVRGLAPATRETDLCRPGTLVERAHAILLTGGSAFGLNAAAGVMRFLRERDIGYGVGGFRVPIVPGAAIFDLGLGHAVWPDEAMGYAACVAASSGPVDQGTVGAGTGASVGKILGPLQATKSGIGSASVLVGMATVGALVVVNAVGDVVLPGTSTIAAGARDPHSNAYVDAERFLVSGASTAPMTANTVIGVVATDADINSEQTNYLASIAHDALARTIRPAHTVFDGDTLFALATGQIAGDWREGLIALAVATVVTMERAVVHAIQHAASAGGLPAGRVPIGW